MTTDASAFHDFEQAGWQRAAEHYGDAFGALTIQAAESLLDAVDAAAGTRLLDVATGPGVIAAAAAARGARVVGLDFSPAMIAEARRRHPALAFRDGDAEALPFENGAFDAVVMNFGMLHLAHPEAAMMEARRVLRPGGHYAFTVWGAPELAIGFGLVIRAVEKFGRADVGLPAGPPFFQFSDAATCKQALASAGYSSIDDVRLLRLTWRLQSADAVFAAVSSGGVRTAAVLRAQTPEALAAIRDAVREGVEAYALGGGYEVPMPAVLASASK